MQCLNELHKEQINCEIAYSMLLEKDCLNELRKNQIKDEIRDWILLEKDSVKRTFARSK